MTVTSIYKNHTTIEITPNTIITYPVLAISKKNKEVVFFTSPTKGMVLLNGPTSYRGSRDLYHDDLSISDFELLINSVTIENMETRANV